MADPDYFTTAELQALPDCSVFDETAVLNAAAYFTEIVEREVGVPFKARTFTETLDGSGTYALVLGYSDVSLTTVTVGGASVDVTGLTAESGLLRYKAGGVWTLGVANVVVAYTAGPATCPADIKDAVMWATRDRLLGQSDQSGIDIRRTTVSTEFGTTSYILPGEKRPTGYPDLDAVIASYSRSTPNLGFA